MGHLASWNELLYILLFMLLVGLGREEVEPLYECRGLVAPELVLFCHHEDPLDGFDGGPVEGAAQAVVRPRSVPLVSQPPRSGGDGLPQLCPTPPPTQERPEALPFPRLPKVLGPLPPEGQGGQVGPDVALDQRGGSDPPSQVRSVPPLDHRCCSLSRRGGARWALVVHSC